MADRRLIQYARDMRRGQTDAERKVWARLRGHRLGGHRFRRQHPVAGYIADFYCQAAGLVVELDGGQHADPQAATYDARRTAALAAEGIEVVRYSDLDALRDTDAVARDILRHVERRLAEKHVPPAGNGT